MLEKEAKRRGTNLPALLKPEYYEGILKKYAFSELEDIYGAVGYGGIAATYVINRLLDEQRQKEEPEPPSIPEVTPDELQANRGKPTHGIYVKGQSGMLVRFAKCCNPIPGDEIVGYITRGRGVTVHKVDCVNANSEETERIVEVSWAADTRENFDATIQITAYDRVGLLGDLTVYIGNLKVSISAISAKSDLKHKTITITLVLQVNSRDQLDRVIRQLKKRSDVLQVYRGHH